MTELTRLLWSLFAVGILWILWR